ncbi:MAG: glycosyltransferase [Candidatus Sulfomarinibacteraceae bacterium]
MSPKISVIIPSFNHEAFVDRAISSALESGGDGLEVVVVDDGSTDASRDRFERYEDDPRVRIHLQDNRGAHAALNRGLELAEGDIAFILDSDDAFHPDRIPVLTRRLADNPAAVLSASWIQVIDADGAELGVKQAWRTLPPWPAPAQGPRLSDLGDPRLALLETNWISTTSNLAFPMTLIRDHGLRFSPLRYTHDWDFILSACHLGDLELVEEPLVQYRVHETNTIGEGADEGRGRMRFEIMWVVARHAARLLRAIAADDAELLRLRELLSSSAPTFGCDAVFDQLLVLRGAGEDCPAAYDALTDPGHPFTRAAVELLQD